MPHEQYKQFSLKIIISAILLNLCSCTHIIEGYRFNEDKLEDVKEQETTLSQTRIILGPPTIKESSPYTNEPILIYASADILSFLFVRRYVKDRRIMMLHYKDRMLMQIENKSLEDGSKSRIRSISVRMKKPNKLWTLPLYTLI